MRHDEEAPGGKTISNAAPLRAALARHELLVAPGAHDCITARLVEKAGFGAVYMSGLGTAAMLGYPDYGLATLSEFAANAGRMVDAVGIPVIADADTGFGNELNVIRTVREYESRGVAAIQLEEAWACNDCQKCRFQTRICPCGQFSGRCLSPWWFGLATGGYSAASHFR